MVECAQKNGFPSDQIKAFAAMRNLSLDGPNPKKNVNFDQNVKDSNKTTSRRRSKVGTPKDVDKTSRGPATISAEKEPASRTPFNRIGRSSLLRAARGVRLEEKLSSTGPTSTDSTTKIKDPSSSKRRRSTKGHESSRQAKGLQEETPAKPRSISTPYSGPSLDDDDNVGWTEVSPRRRRASDRDSSSKPARILRVSSSSKTGDDKTSSTSKRRSGSSRAGAPLRREKVGGTPRRS